MAAVTICSDFGAPKNSLSLFPLLSHLFAIINIGKKTWSIKNIQQHQIFHIILPLHVILAKYSKKQKKMTQYLSHEMATRIPWQTVKTVQYQAHKTHILWVLLSVGLYFILSLISSYNGTGALLKTGVVCLLPWNWAGTLAPADQWSRAEVMPSTFWGNIIQRTKLLPGSLTLSPHSLSYSQGTSHLLARKLSSHGETPWRCPSWRCQVRLQPIDSITPRCMGGLASSGPGSQPSHLPPEAPCMEHRRADLTESPSVPHLQNLTGQ